MIDFYELLANIRLRPEMYIGERKLSTLATFLEGFRCGMGVERANASDPPFGYEFHVWVRKKLYNDDHGLGYPQTILDYCGGDEERALEYFFELVDEYKMYFSTGRAPTDN